MHISSTVCYDMWYALLLQCRANIAKLAELLTSFLAKVWLWPTSLEVQLLGEAVCMIFAHLSDCLTRCAPHVKL